MLNYVNNILVSIMLLPMEKNRVKYLNYQHLFTI